MNKIQYSQALLYLIFKSLIEPKDQSLSLSERMLYEMCFKYQKYNLKNRIQN